MCLFRLRRRRLAESARVRDELEEEERRILDRARRLLRLEAQAGVVRPLRARNREQR